MKFNLGWIEFQLGLFLEGSKVIISKVKEEFNLGWIQFEIGQIQFEIGWLE